MKYKSIYLLAGIFIMIASASCKKELLKENTNPEAVNAAGYNPNFLLSTVQLNYTGSPNFGADTWQTEWGGIAGYIQHVSSTNTAFYYGDKYLPSVGNEGEYFDQAYTTQVQPLVELFELTLNKPQYANLHRMAEIMRALVFQRLTDMYGDVPYFQAGLGYYDRIYTPVYDKQQDIYMDMLKQVSNATDSLDENADKPTGDIYYSGASDQIGEWKEFGNSLLLRIAMRLTKVDPATAQAYAKKAVGNTMQSNDDDAVVQHIIGSVYQNRDAWTILQEDSGDIRLSDTYINSMKESHDPRLSNVAWLYPAQDTVSSDQLGMPRGYIFGGVNTAFDITQLSTYPSIGLDGYSTFNPIVLSLTSPTLVLTYAETELLLADADTRWPGILGDATPAVTHYNNGVAAAITQYDIYPGGNTTPDQAAAYVTAYPLNAAQATALNQINTEYWKCTFLDEYETWANWRRTSTAANTNAATRASGYPALVPTNYPGNVTSGTIPRRLQYPADQSFSNLVNYQAAVARLSGGDKLTSRMWWDTQ
jgi:hypothetical protein